MIKAVAPPYTVAIRTMRDASVNVLRNTPNNIRHGIIFLDKEFKEKKTPYYSVM